MADTIKKLESGNWVISHANTSKLGPRRRRRSTSGGVVHLVRGLADVAALSAEVEQPT